MNSSQQNCEYCNIFITGTFIMIAIQKSAAISLSTLVTREDRAGDAAMLTGGLSAGLGVMVAILVTGGNSGAHMNPAVSLGNMFYILLNKDFKTEVLHQ